MNKAFKIECSIKQKENPTVVPEPGPPDWVNVVPKRVQDVVEKHEEVLTKQRVEIQEITPEEEGEESYMAGIYRFSETEDEDAITEELKDKFIDAEWYKISYHVCDHDEEKRGGCGKWIVKEEVKK